MLNNMDRTQELEQIKELIKTRYDEARYGLFDCRNITGDTMHTLFYGKQFTLDICYDWMYFEVFGTTKDEFADLLKFYDSLAKNEEREGK